MSTRSTRSSRSTRSTRSVLLLLSLYISQNRTTLGFPHLLSDCGVFLLDLHEHWCDLDFPISPGELLGSHRAVSRLLILSAVNLFLLFGGWIYFVETHLLNLITITKRRFHKSIIMNISFNFFIVMFGLGLVQVWIPILITINNANIFLNMTFVGWLAPLGRRCPKPTH